ncbi:MAG: glycosyl transferase family 2 [Nitrospirae bacterium GWC2_56_14]|nr:MAG: glycosyl transferase family 2 [Nitrospirae bacterium GWC2_56_14]
MLSLSIVIPVYNAEATIEALCNSLVYLYAKKYQMQILLVNDGSKDESDARCRKLHTTYPLIVTYLKLARNFGEHNAVMAGLNHATGEYCVVMDDDLQNPPEELEKLVDEIQKGYDVVYARYASKQDSLFRNMGSAFHDKVATLFLKKPVNLYLSSFKVMNRFLLNEVIKYSGPDPYVDGIVLRTTDNISTIPVKHHQRPSGRSGYTLGKLISIWGSMVVSYSLVPLRLIGIVGLLITAGGVVYGIFKAYDDLHTYGKLTDFETLMSANLTFRGLTMMAVSILGEYVGRIYVLLNHDPQFVVRELVTLDRKQGQVKSLSSYKGRDEQILSSGNS